MKVYDITINKLAKTTADNFQFAPSLKRTRHFIICRMNSVPLDGNVTFRHDIDYYFFHYLVLFYHDATHVNIYALVIEIRDSFDRSFKMKNMPSIGQLTKSSVRQNRTEIPCCFRGNDIIFQSKNYCGTFLNIFRDSRASKRIVCLYQHTQIVSNSHVNKGNFMIFRLKHPLSRLQGIDL